MHHNRSLFSKRNLSLNAELHTRNASKRTIPTNRLINNYNMSLHFCNESLKLHLRQPAWFDVISRFVMLLFEAIRDHATAHPPCRALRRFLFFPSFTPISAGKHLIFNQAMSLQSKYAHSRSVNSPTFPV